MSPIWEPIKLPKMMKYSAVVIIGGSTVCIQMRA